MKALVPKEWPRRSEPAKGAAIAVNTDSSDNTARVIKTDRRILPEDGELQWPPKGRCP